MLLHPKYSSSLAESNFRLNLDQVKRSTASLLPVYNSITERSGVKSYQISGALIKFTETINQYTLLRTFRWESLVYVTDIQQFLIRNGTETFKLLYPSELNQPPHFVFAGINEMHPDRFSRYTCRD